jgi:hypothetical protein
MPEWRRQDMVGEVIEMQVKKQGIWWNCQYFSTGQWHCDDFDRMLLGLPPELQAARALMVIGCMFGFLGYLLSNVGLACTSMMADSPDSKRKGKSPKIDEFNYKYSSRYNWRHILVAQWTLHWSSRYFIKLNTVTFQFYK